MDADKEIEYNSMADKYTNPGSGKGRSKKEQEQNTNRPDPCGDTRKLVEKFKNTEKNRLRKDMPTCSAILPGETTTKNVPDDNPKPDEKIRDQNQTSLTLRVSSPDKATKLDSNSTFYYEADTFLLNKSEAPSERTARNQETTPIEWGPIGKGGRSGRMLDLDALVGDIETSRANKELRSQLTSRQSRNLNHQLDIGGGKRLHIQGFIPIVGLKDSDELQEEGTDKSSGELNEMAPTNSGRQPGQRPRLKMVPTGGGGSEQSSLMKLSGSAPLYESPFGQSSMGHATFNVQRLLSTDNQQQVASSAPVEMFGQNQQMVAAPSKPAAKYTAGLVETLKRPIQKLANTFGSSNNDQQQQKLISQQQQQNCLCVPNYMCKNGYLSESGLSRVQVQQMISQQQSARQSVEELISGQPQSSLIDERSAEQNANLAPTTEATVESTLPVVMNNLEVATNGNQESSTTGVGGGGGEPSQQSTPNQFAGTPPDDSAKPVEQDGVGEQSRVNSSTRLTSFQPIDEMTTLNQANNDYTQDILGRMLGLKAANSRVSLLGSASPQTSQHQAPPATSSSCGLLRTCCNIPVSFFAPVQHQEPSGLAAQQVVALQRYQQIPAGRPQLSYEQPAASNIQTSPLYHRSSPSMGPINSNPAALQYQQYQQQQQQHQRRMSFSPNAMTSVQQFARAPPAQQPLQTFQPQQLRQSPASSIALSQSPQVPARYMGLQSSPTQAHSIQLGTRKLLEGRCGLRQSAGVNGRVQNVAAGGENSADFGEYPAQAAILKRLNGSESLFVCSGTLVSQSWVATAAHCIRKHMAPAGGGQALQLRVRLGEWDVHRDDEFYGHVEKDVRDLIIHPDFIPGNLINDIALLRLDSPIDSTLPHVMPACLPASDESFARQRCWVAGWGKDAFGQTGAFQSTLQEVELPVWSHADCEQALRQTRLGPHYRLHPGFVCAGGELGKDACEGDGGSGLYCSQEGGVIKVAGLVSWGISCGQQNVPGVFVSIPHYRAWIENIIALDDDIYSPYNVLPISNGLVSERNATPLGGDHNSTTTGNGEFPVSSSREQQRQQESGRNETSAEKQ